MKKFFQICLIAIFVFVLLQAVVGDAVMVSGQMDPAAASWNSSTSNVSAEGSHAAACMVRVKGVICVMPNVGWNS